MKKLLVLVAIMLGGAYAVRSLLADCRLVFSRSS